VVRTIPLQIDGTSNVLLLPTHNTVLISFFPQKLNVPLLIVHAENDWDIPHSHSQTLFDAFLDQHLPPLPEIAAAMAGASDEVMEKVDRLSKEWRALRRDLVMASGYPASRARGGVLQG